MNITKSIKLQISADKVATLADMIEEMGEYLDKMHSEMDDDLFSEVRAAWPPELFQNATKKLRRLVHTLTPSED